MSRSGYIEVYDDDASQLHLYRSLVKNAIRSERGQKFFADLVAALDAMPVKELVREELETKEGAVCAIGALGRARGVDVARLDPEDASFIASKFDIAECLARETVFENDEHDSRNFQREPERPEARWFRMRAWAVGNIKTRTMEATA